jgi:hypothetical protein
MMTVDKKVEIETHMTEFLKAVEAYITSRKTGFLKNPSAGVVTIVDDKLHQEMQGEASKILFVVDNQLDKANGNDVHPDDLAAPKAMTKIRETIAMIERDPATKPETKTLLGKVKDDLNEIDGPQSRVTHSR